MLDLKELPNGISLQVRVAPRSARSEIRGEHAGALKVTLTAPPADGEANAMLCELLAEALRVPKSAVQIKSGQRGRLKTLHVAGVSRAAVESLLEQRTR